MANMKQAFVALGTDIKSLREADARLTALLAKVGGADDLTGFEDTLLETLNTLKQTVGDLRTGSVTESRAAEIAAEKVTALVNGAPEALDTINELAAAIQANQGGVAGLLATIGALDTLVTTEKTSLVGAINEVKGLVDTAQQAAEAAQQAATAADKAGELTELTTTAKGSVVEAVNELKAALDAAKQAATGAVDGLKAELEPQITAAAQAAAKAQETADAAKAKGEELEPRVAAVEAALEEDFLKAYTDARDGVAA